MPPQQTKRFTNLSRHTVLASETRVASTFAARLRGLLFSPQLRRGQGLLIEPCSSIHMMGMVYPIDVVFCDKDWRVVGIVESIPPFAISPIFPSAKCCVELPAGTIAESNTAKGDQMEIAEIAS